MPHNTKVGQLRPIAALESEAPSQPLVRLAWRSFDRQWTFDDPRLAKTDSPALWQSLSEKQMFLVSPKTARLSGGPALTIATVVPDKHYFNNRGGKDVIPLYRDAEARQPNVTEGLLEVLSERWARSVTPEGLAAYVMGVAGHPGYTEKFSEALESSPVRLPLTAQGDLAERAIGVGEQLLWLQTYGERFYGQGRPQGRVPRIAGLGWTESVSVLPESMQEIDYDAMAQELIIGDGRISGVRPEVRAFAVSGMNILDKWLGARTRKGVGRAAGKAATPLDLIRPTEWVDAWNDELLDLLRVLTATVDLAGEQAELLQQILDSDLIPAAELPQPTADEQKVPKTIKRDLSDGQSRAF